MANVQLSFNASDAIISSTGIPELVIVQPGTPASQGTETGYAFATGEFVQFQFRAFNYASGNLTVDVDWWSRSGSTANNCAFSAAIFAYSPSTDTTALTAKNYATATQAQTTAAATGGRLFRTSVTVSNLDSLAIDDFVMLKVARATPTGTDMTGDAVVTLVSVLYLSV